MAYHVRRMDRTMATGMGLFLRFTGPSGHLGNWTGQDVGWWNVEPISTPEPAAEIAPLTLRFIQGKCVCSSGDHGHDRWHCPGDAVVVPEKPYAHRCVACWGRIPSSIGWPT